MKGNHGRLFTESDVRELVAKAAARGALAHDDLGIVDSVMADVRDGREHDLTFAPDEPLFVLRGSDPVTGPTIAAYTLGLLNMDELSEDDPRVAAAAATREAIEAWQSENPDRVKVPD